MSFRLLAVLPLALAGPVHAEQVWHWQECANPIRLHITVEADGARLADTTIPVCRRERARIVPEAQQRMIRFPAGQVAGRLGSPDAATLTGNLWEAGAEDAGLVLGVSFQTRERVLVNALHLAFATQASRSEVAPGVVVHTRVDRDAFRARL